MRSHKGSAGVRAVVILLVGAALVAALPAASSATNRDPACSTKGLSFSYRSGSVTYGDKVSDLKATGASCATARDVATVTAKKLLHGKPVPSVIDHFTVHVKSPCAACTPVSYVTATKGSAKTTFKVLGGA